MRCLTLFRSPLALAVLALLVLLALAEPAAAGFGEYFAFLSRRDRVVQFCVVVMLIALFIMIKKFGPGDR